MKVVAHSPTIVERMSLPYRIVLVEKPDEYVVWAESFDPNENNSHLGYHQGNYYNFKKDDKQSKINALKISFEKFKERSEKITEAIKYNYVVEVL